MGLTPFDVQNLNSAIAGVGNAFAQNRAQAMQQQHLGIEEELRQKQLEGEMRRLTIEEGRQKLLGEGNVDAWLQGEDDDGAVHFQGPHSGLQQLMQGAEAKGKPMTILDQPPTAKPQFGVFRTSTPLGDLEFHLSSAEDVDKIAALAKKMGGSAINHASSQPAAVAQDQYAQQLITDAEKQAQGKEAQAASVGPGGTDYAQELLGQAQQIRAEARARADHIRVDPTQLQTIRQNQLDDNGHVLGFTERKAPAQAATSAAPAAAAPEAPADPKQRVAGHSYSTPKGVLRWTGTGWVK